MKYYIEERSSLRNLPVYSCCTTRDLPQITQPVILFHSPQDHVVPPACSQLFLSRISSEDVTDVVLHDSYHVATLDNDAGLIEDRCVAFITRVADQ